MWSARGCVGLSVWVLFWAFLLVRSRGVLVSGSVAITHSLKKRKLRVGVVEGLPFGCQEGIERPTRFFPLYMCPPGTETAIKSRRVSMMASWISGPVFEFLGCLDVLLLLLTVGVVSVLCWRGSEGGGGGAWCGRRNGRDHVARVEYVNDARVAHAAAFLRSSSHRRRSHHTRRVVAYAIYLPLRPRAELDSKKQKEKEKPLCTLYNNIDMGRSITCFARRHVTGFVWV